MTTPLDPAAIARLFETLGDDAPELVVELIDTFFEEAPALVAAIRAGLAAGDSDRVRRAAHSLKQNAATLGASDLMEVSRDLEVMARSGDLRDAAPFLARIEAGYTPTRSALDALAQKWAGHR